jgi:hypothetical protein
MAVGIAHRWLDPLIAEARRRARIRRTTLVALAVAIAALGAAAFLTFRGGSATKPPLTVRRATADVMTLRLPRKESVIYALRRGSLYSVVVEPGSQSRVRLMRTHPDGSGYQKHAQFDLPGYVADLSTGPEGVYLGTSVIPRFTNAQDELVRFDPRSLTERARASFPAAVATVAGAKELWAALGNGRVLRLDPRTLAIEASARVGHQASDPTLGLGSLWVLAGHDLIRMDPRSLAVESRTNIPVRHVFTGISADTRHMYLVGGALAPVDAAGRIGRPIHVPGLATAALNGKVLVGLTNGKPALLELTLDGRVIGTTPLKDAGASLAATGQGTWFLGNVGAGNGLVYVPLRARP